MPYILHAKPTDVKFVNKFWVFGEVLGWGRILLRKKELKKEF